MQIDEYFAWWPFSGTGLGTATSGEKFQQLHSELSEPGAHCVILCHFLSENGDVIDVNAWQRSYVAPDLEFEAIQIRMTADALDAVGAKGAAAAVRQVKGKMGGLAGFMSEGMSGGVRDFAENATDNPRQFMRGFLSAMGADEAVEQMDEDDPEQIANAVRNHLLASMPPGLVAGLPDELRQDIESKAKPKKQTPGTETVDEILAMANAYAAAYSNELQSDIDKYGDPRLAADFDEEQFLNEREHHSDVVYAQRMQLEELPELRKMLERFRKQADSKPGDRGTQTSRRELMEDYQRFAKLPDTELTDEMQAWIREVEQFRSDRPEAFTPKASPNDDVVNAKLAAIGPYETDFSSGMSQIEWSNLAELNCEWTKFELEFLVVLPGGKSKPKELAVAYDALIEGWNSFKPRFAEIAPLLRAHVLEIFRDIYADQLTDYEREEYQDADGEISDESILGHVNSGSLQFGYDGDDVDIECFLDVAWDEEHGVPVEFDADGEIIG